MKEFRFKNDDTPEHRTRKLNELSRAVTDTLSNGVSVRDNLAAEWIDVSFTGPASPLSMLTSATVEPMGVMLVYLRNTATNAAVSLADTFSWTFSGSTGSGQIVTTSFSGLTAGIPYKARLLVLLR